MPRKKGDEARQIPPRVNYLYQAAHCVLAQDPNNTQLARFYIDLMKSVSTKVVMRLQPDIKRTICKKCNALLVPGVTATVRIRGRRQKHVVVKCMDCGRVKRFNANDSHVLWVDRPEGVVEKTQHGQSANKTAQHGQSSSADKSEKKV